MKIVIHPYEGIEIPTKGHIRFGMRSNEVRTFFDELPNRSSGDKPGFFSEHFRSVLVMVQYREPDYLYGISFAQSENQVLIEDQSLFSMSYLEVKAWLREKDPYLTENTLLESLDSGLMGISIGIAYPEDDGTDVKTPWIFIFDKRYSSATD